MKAKQYAWVHVLTNGKINRRPSYFGGWQHIDSTKDRNVTFYNMSRFEKEEVEQFLKDIKKYGVNWDKTDDIQSETYSKFAGTFCDSIDTTYLEGWMTLNNGSKAFWCSDNVDASDVFSVMENAQEYEKKYKEIFEDQ